MSQNMNYAEIRAKATMWTALEFVASVAVMVMITFIVAVNAHGPLVLIGGFVALAVLTLVSYKAASLRREREHAIGYRGGFDA